MAPHPFNISIYQGQKINKNKSTTGYCTSEIKIFILTTTAVPASISYFGSIYFFKSREYKAMMNNTFYGV